MSAKDDQQLGQVVAHLRAAVRSLETAEHMSQGMEVCLTGAREVAQSQLLRLEMLRGLVRAQL
jgi:hypothetical protein